MGLKGQFHVPAFLPHGKESMYQLDKGSVDLRADLDIGEKKEISCPCREWKPGRVAYSLSL
jgi:hypothetical protein